MALILNVFIWLMYGYFLKQNLSILSQAIEICKPATTKIYDFIKQNNEKKKKKKTQKKNTIQRLQI